MADREDLGRTVRAIWITWAMEQPNPKPSWLVPYDELAEADKEVDRRIGDMLYGLGQTSRNGEVERLLPIPCSILRCLNEAVWEAPVEISDGPDALEVAVALCDEHAGSLRMLTGARIAREWSAGPAVRPGGLA